MKLIQGPSLLRFLMACLLISLSGHTMAQPFQIDLIGVGDGLTQGSLYSMLQDSRGFLWLGSQDGLNRYDGSHFRQYHPDPKDRRAITGINVFGIAEDSQGNLWVGTEDGLNRYDRASDHFQLIPSFDNKGRRIKSKTIPFYADDKVVLFLSETKGLVSLDLKTFRQTVLHSGLRPIHEYDQLNSTLRTPAGDIWLQAPKGLIRYNLKDGQVHRYFSDHPTNEAGSPQSVFSFHCDPSGMMWLGTAAGLIRFSPSKCTYQVLTPSDGRPLSAVYSITEDKQGQLWLGTQRMGIWLFDKDTEHFQQLNQFTDEPKRLSDYEICKIYVDRQGIVWANADPAGLVRVLPENYHFDGMMANHAANVSDNSTTLNSFVVRGFQETTPNELWIATERGIDVLDRKHNRIIRRYLTLDQPSDVPQRATIKCLYKSPFGQIWVGAINGLFLFEPASSTFRKIPLPPSSHSLILENDVRQIHAVDANTLLVGTEDGLYQLDTRTFVFTRLPLLKGKSIFSFLRDRAGRFWVGTYLSGFYCFQYPPNGKRPGLQRVVSGLDGFTIMSFYEDVARKTIWFGTQRGLAALYLPTGKIRLFTQKDGLANPFIYGILPDHKKRLWLSTNRGLSRFTPETKTFKNFDVSDGLQGYEYNGNAYYRTADGELFFGGVNGFNRFYPEQFQISSYTPNVHIYNLRVNEEPYQTDHYIGEVKKLTLPYDHNTLYLEFAAQDFYGNGRNLYQYQLSGYDPYWVQAGTNTYVRYANLPPGNYTFLVKTANKDGQWSSKVQQLSIVIERPFWLRAWFILLMLAAVCAGGYVWLRRRENRISRQHQRNTRLAVRLQEQIKKDLARDLHDEVGTRLATLKIYISNLIKASQQNNSAVSMGDDSRQLISDIVSDVRNLLRQLSPRTLEQYGYMAAVEELLSRIDESTLVTHFWADELPGRPEQETELMLYRITQELLNNTLKHANAQEVNIRLVYENNWLKLYYNDDGQGFDYEKASRGLGISNIESRVALLNGHIEWHTAPNAGTSATVEIPFRSISRFQLLKGLERSLRKVATFLTF